MIETPGCALVVVPHPDDAEGWCGGTVARWTSESADVFYVLCTDGGKGSSNPETVPEELAAIREREQMAAASVLGVKDVVLLRHPDGELEDTAGYRKELVRAIRRFKPDILLCPEPYKLSSYWHRDHRIAGQVAADAAFPYARDHLHFQELLTEEGLETHKTGMVLFWNPDLPDVHMDIKSTIDLKTRALSCHESQISQRANRDVAESVRERARNAAEGTDLEYAEAYRKVEFRR